MAKECNIIRLFQDGSSCSGCSACMNICSSDAIRMKEDEYGFLFPEIQQEKCVGCGLCSKVCNYQHKQETVTLGETYVAMAYNKELLNTSASGGVFAAIASRILSEGGVVFGCALEYDDGICVHHIKVDKIEDIHKLQGSKYVQSNIDYVYREVREIVKTGKTVLFSGTPCQVAGLKGFFLNRIPDNLFTVDIICHGVGNQQFFLSYLERLGQKIKGVVKNYSFRDKTNGWGLHAKALIENNRGKHVNYHIAPDVDSHYWLFLRSEIYRESCYSCPYAGEQRPGDVTVGDYWEIEQEHPEILVQNGGLWDEKQGISCLIINQRKGYDLIDRYGADINMLPSAFEKVSRWNKQLRSPSVYTKLRKKILESYRNRGYKGVEKVYYVARGWKYPLKVIKRKLDRGKNT